MTDHSIEASVVGEMEGLAGKAGGVAPQGPVGVVTAILLPNMQVIELEHDAYLFVPLVMNVVPEG